MKANWYDILLKAAQNGELDPADIPTVLHWRGTAMRIEEWAGQVLQNHGPYATAYINEAKQELVELGRHLAVDKINFQTVRSKFGRIQVLLYLASSKVDVDMDLATVNFLKGLEEYARANAGYPYSD